MGTPRDGDMGYGVMGDPRDAVDAATGIQGLEQWGDEDLQGWWGGIGGVTGTPGDTRARTRG